MKYLILVFFLMPIVFFGQQTKSLKTCIELAKKQNSKVVYQHYLNQKLHRDKAISKAAFLPNLRVNANQNFNLGSSFNVSTGVGQQESSSNIFSIVSNVTLFEGFSKVHQMKLANMKLDNAALELKNIEQELERSITNEYLQALFYKEALKIAQRRQENSKEQFLRVKGLFDQEVITKSELLENESLVASDQNSCIEITNNLRTSLLKLKSLISYEDINDFDVEAFDSEGLHKEYLIDISKMNVDTTSLQNYSSIQLLDSEMQLKNQLIKTSKSNFYPKISFDYSFGTGYYHILGREDVVFNSQTQRLEDNGFFKQINANKIHYLGFSMTIPIFNRLETKQEYKKRKLDYNISEIRLKAEKTKIKNQIKQAFYDVETAYSSHQNAQTILVYQKEVFRVASEKYRLGISSIYEFIESRNRLSKAESDFLSSKYDYIFKVKLLDYFFR